MGLKLITAPTSEPVSVAEAKAHLRVVGTDDDAYIGSLITAARQSAESITGRALMPQTWEFAVDEFKSEIRLNKPPFSAVSSIKYIDKDGVQQTLAEADYILDSHSEPARVTSAYSKSWPYARKQANSVLIRFTAGYADAAAVPQEIKNWMLLRVGMLYENRESVAAGMTLDEVPHVDRLLSNYIDWSR